MHWWLAAAFNVELLAKNEILHGELPDNVVLNPQTGMPVIIDFDESVAPSEQTNIDRNSTDPVGTPRFPSSGGAGGGQRGARRGQPFGTIFANDRFHIFGIYIVFPKG